MGRKVVLGSPFASRYRALSHNLLLRLPTARVPPRGPLLTSAAHLKERLAQHEFRLLAQLRRVPDCVSDTQPRVTVDYADYCSTVHIRSGNPLKIP